MVKNAFKELKSKIMLKNFQITVILWKTDSAATVNYAYTTKALKRNTITTVYIWLTA